MSTTTISRARAQEIIDALRRGTVPRASLDAFCVGLERFEAAVDADLEAVASGRGVFKAVRLRLRQDVLHSLARRSGSPKGVRDK